MPSPYTFTKNAQGNIETFQNGQRISTGTASSAERYGYVEPTPNAPKVETPQLFSSNKGQTIIENAKAKETKLAGVPAPTPTSTPVAQPTPTTSKVSLVNEAGQTVDFENPDINKSNIESYLKSGYSLKSASGAIPSWLSPTSTGAMVTPPTQTETDLGNAKAERDTLVNNLKNFNVSNDPALQQMLSGISAGWDTRINEMERVNKSRAAAVTQTGVRLGSRYTGGAGGMFGSVISVEEKDATQRIATLEGQKQSNLLEAKNAYENKKWAQYAKLVDLADKNYAEQLDAVKELNKAQVSQDKILREEKSKESESIRLLTIGASVSDSLSSGITDINEIFRQAIFSGIQVTPKEISEAFKSLETTEKIAPGIVGEWQSAVKADLSLKGMGLNEYLDFKDPTRALDIRQQELTIKKLEKDLTGKGIDEDPVNMLAYAQQYAVTGMIPTGLPKGTFGVVANAAKELPRSMGSIVNSISGVTDSKVPADQQADFVRLVNITSNVKRLKDLDQKRVGGLLSGTLGKIFGSEDQSKYLNIRKAIVDDMSRMMSGAALSEDEVTFYEDYLPGRLSETFGLGEDSLKKIQNFEETMNNRLSERLASNGLSIYGYSKVKIGKKEYTVGDIVSNEKGEMGRVLPDGSISTQ